VALSDQEELLSQTFDRLYRQYLNSATTSTLVVMAESKESLESNLLAKLKTRSPRMLIEIKNEIDRIRSTVSSSESLSRKIAAIFFDLISKVHNAQTLETTLVLTPREEYLKSSYDALYRALNNEKFEGRFLIAESEGVFRSTIDQLLHAAPKERALNIKAQVDHISTRIGLSKQMTDMFFEAIKHEAEERTSCYRSTSEPEKRTAELDFNALQEQKIAQFQRLWKTYFNPDPTKTAQMGKTKTDFDDAIFEQLKAFDNERLSDLKLDLLTPYAQTVVAIPSPQSTKPQRKKHQKIRNASRDKSGKKVNKAPSTSQPNTSLIATFKRKSQKSIPK